MRPATLLTLGFILMTFALSMLSGAEESDAPPQPLKVYVSIPPQAYFVERIGAERVRVEVLLKPGQSPAMFTLTPRRMADLARADVYFGIGVPFEQALRPRFEEPSRRLIFVDTARGLPLRRIDDGHEIDQSEAGVEHREHNDVHQHGADPHTWLNPLLAVRQVETIRDTLTELDPEGTETYRRNTTALIEDLRRVHERIAHKLKPYKGRDLFVYHPSFGYFTDAYGLRQVAVEGKGRAPGPRRIERLIQTARRRRVKVIFAQPQFSRAGAKALAEAIDGEVVELDPLARHYLHNLEKMATKIQRALAD